MGNRPNWNAKFFAADHTTLTIVREQSDELVYCEEPKFDEYVCLTYEDLMRLETDVLSKCEKWQGDSQPSLTDDLGY